MRVLICSLLLLISLSSYAQFAYTGALGNEETHEELLGPINYSEGSRIRLGRACSYGSGELLGSSLPLQPEVWWSNGRSNFHGFLFPFERATEAFEFMNYHSYSYYTKRNGPTRKERTREVAAWITTEGILVQPWNGPLVDKDGKVVVGYAANSISWNKGNAYNNFLPFDVQLKHVYYQGRWLRIVAQVHTHPDVPLEVDRSVDQHTTESIRVPVYAVEHQTIVGVEGQFIANIKKPAKFIRNVLAFADRED